MTIFAMIFSPMIYIVIPNEYTNGSLVNSAITHSIINPYSYQVFFTQLYHILWYIISSYFLPFIPIYPVTVNITGKTNFFTVEKDFVQVINFSQCQY